MSRSKNPNQSQCSLTIQKATLIVNMMIWLEIPDSMIIEVNLRTEVQIVVVLEDHSEVVSEDAALLVVVFENHKGQLLLPGAPNHRVNLLFSKIMEPRNGTTTTTSGTRTSHDRTLVIDSVDRTIVALQQDHHQEVEAIGAVLQKRVVVEELVGEILRTTLQKHLAEELVGEILQIILQKHLAEEDGVTHQRKKKMQVLVGACQVDLQRIRQSHQVVVAGVHRRVQHVPMVVVAV